MTRKRAAALAIIGMLLPAVAPALAAGAEAPPPEAEKQKEAAKEAERQPIHVWADRIRYLRDQNLARITGDATIIKRDLRIDADEVVATLDPGTSRFKEITATGKVRIHTVVPIAERTTKRPPLEVVPDSRRATCGKAVYDPATGVVILTGTGESQPVVWIGNDKVQANTITYDRTKGVVLFEGAAHLSGLIPKQAEKPGPPPAPK